MDATKVLSSPSQLLISIADILIFAPFKFAKVECFTSESSDQIVVSGIIFFAFRFDLVQFLNASIDQWTVEYEDGTDHKQ